MKNRILLFAGLILTLGITLRCMNVGRYGIWFDEKYSVLTANGISDSALSGKTIFTNKDVKELSTFSNVVKANISRDGGNGILYAGLLYCWTNIFGPSDVSARMISVLFGVALILLVFFFTRDFLKDHNLALIAMFLVAISPLLVIYSQQVRAYEMAAFFSMAATYCFLKIIFEKDNRQFLIYTLYTFCVVCSLLSHYQTAYVFIGHALIMLVFSRDKKVWLAMLPVFSLVVLCLGIWYFNGGAEGFKMINQRNEIYKMLAANFHEGGNHFALPATPKYIAAGWGQLLLQMTGNQLQIQGFHIRVLLICLVFPLVLLGGAWYYGRRSQHRKIITSLFILFMCAPLYATLLALVSGHIISFQSLYAIFAVPYLMILIAAGFYFLIKAPKPIHKFIAGGAALGFMALCAVSFIPVVKGTFISPVDRKENPYVETANQLKAKSSPGDTIVFPSLIDAQLTNIYMTLPDQVIQKVDTKLDGKFILKTKAGEVQIADFKKDKLYY